MKSISSFYTTVVIFLLSLVYIPVQAQTKKAPPVPLEGSWVVEWAPGNRQCIVRFYNDQQQLIYEETVSHRLNIARRQTKQSLNVALEQAMYVWNATHKVPTDRQWVAVQFSRK